MNQDRRLELAAASQKGLEELHELFMRAVNNLETKQVNGAAVDSVEGELRVTCLGVDLQANHRLVANAQGELALVEYPFQAQHKGEHVLIWTIYLAPDERLYSDPERTENLYSMTNKYLASFLGTRLASKLLSSPIFAPQGLKAA